MASIMVQPMESNVPHGMKHDTRHSQWVMVCGLVHSLVNRGLQWVPAGKQKNIAVQVKALSYVTLSVWPA